MFRDIVGQEQVKEVLSGMMAADAVPHALLFVGPEGVGKGETAFALARHLLCERGLAAGCRECDGCRRATKLEHPDLYVVFPMRAAREGGRDAWIGEYDTMRRRLAEAPYAPVFWPPGLQIVKGIVAEVHDRLRESALEGGRKVCVILHADRLNPATGNALLKILEEPPRGVHFILTTERLSTMLPTIVSRSSVVRFRRLRTDEIAAELPRRTELDAGRAVSYAREADGSLKAALALASGERETGLDTARALYRAAAAGGDDAVIVQTMEFLGFRDQGLVGELLTGFITCTREVLECRLGMTSGHAGSNELADLAGRTDTARLARLAGTLEDGLEMLDRHVNVPTVMNTLFYGIADAYRK